MFFFTLFMWVCSFENILHPANGFILSCGRRLTSYMFLSNKMNFIYKGKIQYFRIIKKTLKRVAQKWAILVRGYGTMALYDLGIINSQVLFMHFWDSRQNRKLNIGLCAGFLVWQFFSSAFGFCPVWLLQAPEILLWVFHSHQGPFWQCLELLNACLLVQDQSAPYPHDLSGKRASGGRTDMLVLNVSVFAYWFGQFHPMLW